MRAALDDDLDTPEALAAIDLAAAAGADREEVAAAAALLGVVLTAPGPGGRLPATAPLRRRERTTAGPVLMRPCPYKESTSPARRGG